jgi:hypothetical protein
LHEKIKDHIKSIRAIKRRECFHENETEISLDAIKSLICASNTRIHQITIKSFKDTEDTAINGAYIRSGSNAVIYFNEQLNYCWSRMVIAKELVHPLLTNHGKNHQTNNIESLTSNLLYGEFNATMPNDCLEDNLAYLGAIELVMVKYFRKEFKLLSLKFPYALQGFGNLAPS